MKLWTKERKASWERLRGRGGGEEGGGGGRGGREKKARRRAGNRARVEFALTRAVLASGVVARLVARCVNSCPATDDNPEMHRRIASCTRKQKVSTRVFTMSACHVPARGENAQKNVRFESANVM